MDIRTAKNRVAAIAARLPKSGASPSDDMGGNVGALPDLSSIQNKNPTPQMPPSEPFHDVRPNDQIGPMMAMPLPMQEDPIAKRKLILDDSAIHPGI